MHDVTVLTMTGLSIKRTRHRRSIYGLVLLLGMTLWLVGCEPAAIDCPKGTKKVEGSCKPDVPVCAPLCGAEKPCGDDGCGGSCGSCDKGLSCFAGSCIVLKDTCLPKCNGKVCGDDGCGGVCGDCPGGQACDKGVCADKCVPSCVGKGCGADGCGGTCGDCATGLTCSKAQVCVADGWTCDPYRYALDGHCDCNCGAPDPTCSNPLAPVVGCDAYNVCTAGKCTSTIPATWTCALSRYNDGTVCDCDCGAADPDCKVAGVAVLGCKSGQVCDDKGVCAKCVASCVGKTCGNDGCGGSCGGCSGPTASKPKAPQLACLSGKCVDGCLPKPIQCIDAECGDDGCGGSCGTCKTGEFCNSGQCFVQPGKSCKGYCKGSAPGGCSCTPGCEKNGTCCPDYVEECTCQPKCTGRQCGSDGCGGVCGKCSTVAGKPFCDAGGQCQTNCKPVCTGKSCGSDGCGGSCGSCKDGGTCGSTGICIPAEWSCLPFYYADKSLCDCSCGAPDPDCDKIALTSGCPKLATCEAKTGICKTPFCATNGDCKSPSWCIGHYPVGGGFRKGVCTVPDPLAKANGAPCSSDATCANGLCIAGACRAPCQTDKHCDLGASCVAVAVGQGLAGKPKGSVAVCYGATQLGAVCKSQADCSSAGQLCLANAHPTTLKPIFRCGTLPGDLAETKKCEETSQCVPGLLCAGGVCRRPCPAGKKDCPNGYSCSAAILHPGSLASKSDDIVVNACTSGEK